MLSTTGDLSSVFCSRQDNLHLTKRGGDKGGVTYLNSYFESLLHRCGLSVRTQVHSQDTWNVMNYLLQVMACGEILINPSILPKYIVCSFSKLRNIC